MYVFVQLGNIAWIIVQRVPTLVPGPHFFQNPNNPKNVLVSDGLLAQKQTISLPSAVSS